MVIMVMVVCYISKYIAMKYESASPYGGLLCGVVVFAVVAAVHRRR